MLLAGIDEAGYGPLLGPLVVGSACFQVPDNASTDLWAALKPAVSAKRDRKGGKLHVADSKQVYTPSAGLTQLERSVLAFAAAFGLPVTSLDALLAALDPACPPRLRRLPWYPPTFAVPPAPPDAASLDAGSPDAAPSASVPSDAALPEVVLSASVSSNAAVPVIASHDPAAPPPSPPLSAFADRFPLSVSPASLGPDANALRSAMRSANGGGVEGALLALRVLPEADYNDRVRQTRNKGALLFSLAASLIFDLLELATAKRQPLVLVCDRQGGREHYVEPLRTMFPDWSLTVLEEAPAKAVYQLTRAGVVATISFQEKGESESLATALASMFCKYTREALMHRFNAWFLAHDPTLTPTAGYYTDALRFLEDTRALRARLNLPDEMLVRER